MVKIKNKRSTCILALSKKHTEACFLRKVVMNRGVSKRYININQQCFLLFMHNFLSVMIKMRTSVVFIKTYCFLTWRMKSVFSFFKLTRMSLRELSSFGLVRGLTKSAW